MSHSSHSNLSVGSEEDKEDKADAGRCFSRVCDWTSIYVPSTGQLQTELQNQGGELVIAISGKSYEVFLLKGKIP